MGIKSQAALTMRFMLRSHKHSLSCCKVIFSPHTVRNYPLPVRVECVGFTYAPPWFLPVDTVRRGAVVVPCGIDDKVGAEPRAQVVTEKS